MRRRERGSADDRPHQRARNPTVRAVITIVTCLVCAAMGWHLGRAEGRPVSGFLYGLLGPIFLLFFLAGRGRRRDRDAQRIEPMV
jgi:hypothetical protein